MILLETKKGIFFVPNYQFEELIKTKDKIRFGSYGCSNEGFKPSTIDIDYYNDLINWYNLGSPEFFYRSNANLILKLIKNNKFKVVNKKGE